MESRLPLLNRQKMFLNIGTISEFSYIAVCGVPFPENVTIEPIPVPLDLTEVVLATDGYPKVAATLAASEEILREALERDPLCIGVARSTKGIQRGNVSFDDRAYLRVVL
jgi:glycerophosphoryl diester phosphodiesterase